MFQATLVLHDKGYLLQSWPHGHSSEVDVRPCYTCIGSATRNTPAKSFRFHIARNLSKPRKPGARTNTGETGTENGYELRTLDKTWSTKMRRVTTQPSEYDVAKDVSTRDPHSPPATETDLEHAPRAGTSERNKKQRKAEARGRHRGARFIPGVNILLSCCEHGRFSRSAALFVNAELCVHKHGRQHVQWAEPIGR